MYEDFAYTWPVTKSMINEMLAYVDMRDLTGRDFEFMRRILGKTYKRLCKWCCLKDCLEYDICLLLNQYSYRER